MASFTDDGLHWNKTNLHFNELGLPYTVPPWDQTFPQNSFKKYNWDEICQMSGLELLQHFTVRFNPVIWRSRSNLRQVTYRCNLVSACRREFSGFIGVQKMIRHIKRHLAKLEEHRVMNSCCKQYIENLTFYAVGDKFPTGIVTANADCQTATNPEIFTLKSLGNHESKMKNCEKIWHNKKIKTEASENVLRTQNAASNSNDTLVQSKYCKEENNNPITSGEENLDSKVNVSDQSYSSYFTSTSAATSGSTVSRVGFHSKSSSVSNSSFTKPLTSRVRRDDNMMTKEKDCRTVGEVTQTSKRAGVLDSKAYFLPTTNASLKGISDLCKKLKAEEAQLAVVYKEETTPLRLDENCEVKDESYLKPGFKLYPSSYTGQSGIYSHTSQPSNDKNTTETECLVDSGISCHLSTGNDPINLKMTQVATKSVTVSPHENTCNSGSILEVDCEESGFLPGMSSSDAEPSFTAEASSEVSSSNITNQNLQVSQSKYGELLAVIEEIGKDIRPTYAGSKNASERLKKGSLVHLSTGIAGFQSADESRLSASNSGQTLTTMCSQPDNILLKTCHSADENLQQDCE